MAKRRGLISAKGKEKIHLNLLLKSSESLGIDLCNLVLVERQNLQGLQSLEGIVVNHGDFIVVQIKDQQVEQVLQSLRGHRLHLVEGHIQLRQSRSCVCGKKKRLGNPTSNWCPTSYPAS